MIELIERRSERNKTFKLDNNREQLVCSVGDVHYKDNYADKSEQWKDIDLVWEGNRITKAPYELTLEGNKLTIKDKKSGEVSTIELLEIGGMPIPAQAWERSKGLARALDTDLEIVAEYSRVRFARILKSDRAPVEARFKVTGNFIVRASDAEGDLPVETTLKDGILTETLKPDRPIKYPIRIDPTWQVGAGSDDVYRRLEDDEWRPTVTYQMAGGHTASTKRKVGGGMRFLNVTIPSGSIIDTAYLILRASASSSVTVVNTRISADDVDDAVTFSTSADFDARWAGRTTARVDWDAIPAWTSETDYNSPEIKTVIQEIIDRPGWASGQDIAPFWEDFDARSTFDVEAVRQAYSYEGSSTYAPKLVVTYTVVQTLSPTAIPSAEAFGSPTVIPGGVSVAPSGISSEEVFGLPKLNLTLSPSAIPSAEAFGTAILSIGNFLFPSSIGSEEAFGNLVIAGPLIVPGIGSQEAFGSPKLNLSLQPTAITSEELFGLPKLNLFLTPSGIVTGEAFGTAQLNLKLILSAIASAEAFGIPTVKMILVIRPSGLVSAEAFGNPLLIVILAKGTDMKLPPGIPGEVSIPPGQTSIPSKKVSLPWE